MSEPVFIIDCPWCKAKVAAKQHGSAKNTGWYEPADEPYGHRLYLGECPKCTSLLVGESVQRAFACYDAKEDEWSDIVRVYPKPLKTFSSYRIPKVARDSLAEAERTLQADANTAACVMMGRALEALCNDKLNEQSKDVKGNETKKVMLGEGIRQLKENGIIEQRLYDWSQELQAFRNIAAHPDETVISREDASDLQSFVYAIFEYVYDLNERYEEFKDRSAKRLKGRKKISR